MAEADAYSRGRKRLRAARSTLSAVVADLAVLGRQHDSRPRQRRTHPAVDARLHPLGRRVSYPAAVRRAAI